MYREYGYNIKRWRGEANAQTWKQGFMIRARWNASRRDANRLLVSVCPSNIPLLSCLIKPLVFFSRVVRGCRHLLKRSQATDMQWDYHQSYIEDIRSQCCPGNQSRSSNKEIWWSGAPRNEGIPKPRAEWFSRKSTSTRRGRYFDIFRLPTLKPWPHILVTCGSNEPPAFFLPDNFRIWIWEL